MFYVGTFIDPRATEIREMLEALELPIRWLARKMKVDHTTIGTWFEGAKPRDSGAFDKALEIIRTEGFEERGMKVVREVQRLIPVYGGLPAGKPGSFLGEFKPEKFPYSGPQDVPLWGRTIDGDSMKDVFVTGDIAVFHGIPPETSQVGHFFNEATAEELIKCNRAPRGVKELWSFNPEWDPISAEGWLGKGTCIGRIRYGKYGVALIAKFPNGLSWGMRDFDQ